MKQRLSISLFLAAALCLSAACSSADEQQDDMEDARIELRAVTRVAGGDVEYGDIQVLLTCPEEGTSYTGLFKFQQDGEDISWTTSGLRLKTTPRRYNLYGYMPADAGITGTIGVENGDSILTLTNLSPLTLQDVCYVSGVIHSAEEITPVAGFYGFDYQNSESNDRTYLNLTLDHLFGRLVFKIKVDEGYHQLRRIMLKDITIETASASKVTAKVHLMKSGNLGTIDYSISNSNPQSVTLWSGERLLTTSVGDENVGSINVAVGTNLQQYELVCTYDVYDVKDDAPYQLLGTRTARNKLSNLPDKGHESTLTLTVKPTYLYQLSDNDLDNPKVNID